MSAFVHRALVDGAVAEVADADPILAPVLDGEGDAGGQRDVAADDGVAAEKPLLDVEEVHRAALAPGAARHLAQQFRHARPGRHAPGQGVAVIAIGRDQIVVFPEHADRTDRHGLLPAVLVEEAADLVALLVEHLRPFLEPADQHHLAEPDQGLRPVHDRFGFGLHLRHINSTPVCTRGSRRLDQSPARVVGYSILG